MSLFQDPTHPHNDSLFKTLACLQTSPSSSLAHTLQKKMFDALDLKVDQQLAHWAKVIQSAPLFHGTALELQDKVALQGQWHTPLESNLGVLPDYFQPLNSPRNSLEATQHHFFHLHPWRKGPFFLGDLHIDTEWRSDWKWDRVLPHLSSLKGRKVLDVGCGNGYHSWRMFGQQAEWVLGIDPMRVFHAQFRLLFNYIHTLLGACPPVHHLPLTLETLTQSCLKEQSLHLFDTVFSMGVLYHRKDPHLHLKNLDQHLKPGGEVVLETLVVDADTPLEIKGRYAQMRNVWNVVDLSTLTSWMEKAGWVDIKVVDLNQTTFEEQRRTEWMRFYSLSEALDPQNSDLTIEGYPAPLRAICIGRKPI